MFTNRLLRQAITLCNVQKSLNHHAVRNPKFFHSSGFHYEQKKEAEQTAIAHRELFRNIKEKNRHTYLDTIKIFINRESVHRRGHVEFIYAALKNMEEFGVQKDLEVYKALIDVLPKGKFIPENLIQAEFMHYPKQQQCAIDLLEQMEENGVIPDAEMEPMLLSIFGKRGFPLRKYWRMMYWMPKFKNLSPWPVPNPLPEDVLELAKIAISRITSIEPHMKVSVYQTTDIKESIEDTWIVSAQSETQKQLLNENTIEDPVYVEGAFKVWLKGYPINYFILRGKARTVDENICDTDEVSRIKPNIFNLKPPEIKLLKVVPTVHEQEDGVIYSVCATGTSGQDSLLSWIRHLQKNGNPKLSELQVVFTLRSPSKDISTNTKEEEQLKEKIEDK